MKFNITWQSMITFIPRSDEPVTNVSILIAARNEEKNIVRLLDDLNKQRFPKSLFEVIVINDHSEDETVAVVEDFINRTDLSLKIINPVGGLGKKAAIRTGVGQAKGELIVTTDADCRVGKDYLRTIEAFYRENDLKMVTGPVAFTGEKSFFEKLQIIEFASLIGTGAVTLKMGLPSMCNGANLAYEKNIFYQVNGFDGNEQVASGDDEFLMHKVAAKYPGKVAFLKSKEAIVFTSPHRSIKDFYQQRRRWASKWNYYTNFRIQLLAFFVFLQNFLWLAIPVLYAFKPTYFFLIIPVLAFKVIVELVFLARIVKFLNNKFDSKVFLFLQFIYPFYVSFFGIISKSGKYLWKGRRLT